MTNNPVSEDAHVVDVSDQIESLDSIEPTSETSAEITPDAAPVEVSGSATPEAVATFHGVPLMQMPEDLYIPPDALEIFLEAFEGPLDLLLYLIRKNNLDILDIPIADITRQYVVYVELMKEIRLEIAADYLVMAATLAEIKSRMLLPRSAEEPEEEDPRAQLVRRLQEYERIKKAAEDLEQLPRLGREIFSHQIYVPDLVIPKVTPQVELSELLSAFIDILKRSELLATHKVSREALSIRERMSTIIEMVNERKFVEFYECFDLSEGRLGVVVCFIAILELLKIGLIDIVQTQDFGPIHITQCSVVYEGQATNEIFVKNDEEAMLNVDEY